MNSEIIAELNKVLSVVVRVHGGEHPELRLVAELYARLKETADPAVFSELRRVTDNYSLPEDACTAYEKVYRDLAQLEAGQA